MQIFMKVILIENIQNPFFLLNTKNSSWEFLVNPVVRIPHFQWQELRLKTLTGGLRSQKLHGMAKTKKFLPMYLKEKLHLTNNLTGQSPRGSFETN